MTPELCIRGYIKDNFGLPQELPGEFRGLSVAKPVFRLGKLEKKGGWIAPVKLIAEKSAK